MSSYINYAVAQAHQQDLLRAAKKSRIAERKHRKFLVGEVLRTMIRDRHDRQVATSPKVAAAHGA